ncbi:MAG: hypothetical protein EAZ85_15555 [Bacteroidetes bacterium]|nr:MAG: hypothetical protein EAZ85_15555 [Bacteroidota bacterium]TAG88499.1 MAG: hypothetical protein EAZ20_08415 [Bacteroidota bacterium]
MKKIILYLLLVITNSHFLLYGQNEVQIFVYRTDTNLEKIFVKVNHENGEATEISYQSQKDKKPVKLNILKTDRELMRLYVERSDNKEKMTLGSTWAMGNTMFMPDESTKEFGMEVACYAPTGEILLTSGGPMFVPFYYAANNNSKFKKIMIPDAEIPQTLPSGDSYYNIKLPNKQGKYQLITLPYQEGSTKTRLVLVAPNGKKTTFISK